MKKIILVFALLLLLLPQYSESSQGVNVSIHAQSITTPGNDFYVYVMVENITDFNAADYLITYNSSVFAVSEVCNGSIEGISIPLNFSVNSTEGVCRIVQHMGVEGISGTGYLAKILFSCIGEGSSYLNIQGNLSDAEGNSIPATWSGKEILSTSTILRVEMPSQVSGDFNASISIYNVRDFGSVNMTIIYNDSFLYPEEVENGLLGGAEINVSYSIGEGRLSLVGVGGGAGGSGCIAKIKFGTKRVGITAINITDVTISNYSSFRINAFIENKSVFIESESTGYPVADFIWAPLQPKDTDEVKFNSSSSYDINGFIVNWTWNFGDGNVSYEQNPSHQYADDGTYNVTLTVRDNDGYASNISYLISVSNVEPSAHFTFSPLNPSEGDTIYFSDMSSDSDGSVINWTWNFGDGNVSYEQNPSHQYADDGTYNVTLTVRDNDGAVNSSSAEVIFSENHPPYAPSSPSPPDGETDAGINIILSWQCSDVDGDPLTYDIYFGTYGNMQKISSNQTATTLSPGTLDHETTYYWKVVAWDSRGAKNESNWHFITKGNTPPSKPVIKGPSSGYAGYSLTFKASSTDADGDEIRYGFDWNNDGTEDQWTNYHASGADGSITHSWAGEGTYYVKVRAEDKYGAKSEWSDVKVINIQIYTPPPPPPQSPPDADFSFVIEDLTVSFSDMSSDSDGSVVNWTWNFGDGNVSYEQNPSHQYGKYGSYNVVLTVTDNDGLTDEASKKVEIENVAVPDVVVKSIDILPSSPHEGEKMEFVIKISNEGNGDALNVTISYMLDGKLLNSSSLGKLSAGESIEKSFYLNAAKGSHEFSASVSDGINVDKKTINFEVLAAGKKTFPLWVLGVIASLGVAAGTYIAWRKLKK
ncbi:MAG: PKD domain-containing protein [Thermoplasmata archaeon]|nr:MAG: PKD domain-containing protein [Thermoplasmata archaeon]